MTSDHSSNHTTIRNRISRLLRRFFTSLGKGVRAPFIWLKRGYVKLTAPYRQFFTESPDDIPFEEAVRRGITEEAGVVPHIVALQKHILRCLLFFVVMVVLSLWYAPQIVQFLQTPIATYFPDGLGISGPGEIMDLIPRIALVSALFLSLPYFLFEAYLFAAPGLMPRTRWLGLLGVPMILLIFVAGLAYSFYILLPAALDALLQVSEVYGVAEWSLASYLSFASKVMFATQLILFAPLVATGFMVLRRVRFSARYVLVGAFLFAAMLTPGSMVVLDLGLMLLLFLLAGFSYLLARLLFRRRAGVSV